MNRVRGTYLLRLLPENEEHSIDYVGLPTPVWPHNRRETLDIRHTYNLTQPLLHPLQYSSQFHKIVQFVLTLHATLSATNIQDSEVQYMQMTEALHLMEGSHTLFTSVGLEILQDHLCDDQTALGCFHGLRGFFHLVYLFPHKCVPSARSQLLSASYILSSCQIYLLHDV